MENAETATVSSSPVTSSAPATAESKPVLKLTDAAVRQVHQVMKEQNLADHILTIRVVPAGCSGLGYDLNLMKETKAGDLVWQQDGITVCTDAISTKYLTGTEVDFVKTDTSAGFKFSNPNAKSSCGCGTSFSA